MISITSTRGTPLTDPVTRRAVALLPEGTEAEAWDHWEFLCPVCHFPAGVVPHAQRDSQRCSRCGVDYCCRADSSGYLVTSTMLSVSQPSTEATPLGGGMDAPTT